MKERMKGGILVDVVFYFIIIYYIVGIFITITNVWIVITLQKLILK